MTPSERFSTFLAMTVLAGAATFAIGLGIGERPPHHPGCHAEDEIPVYVQHTSYDFHAGAPACVHVDNIRRPNQ